MRLTHTQDTRDQETRWTVGVGIAAIALLMLGGEMPADAAKNRGDRRASMQEEPQSRGTSDMKKIAGTITRTKNVGIRGQERENLVVQVDTKRGKRIVDLGDAEKLEDLDLDKGDKITAWGRSVDIGDKRVLMAHRLKAGDETIDIQREQVPGRPSRDRQGERQMSRDRGRSDEFMGSRSRSRQGQEPRTAKGERYGVEEY